MFLPANAGCGRNAGRAPGADSSASVGSPVGPSARDSAGGAHAPLPVAPAPPETSLTYRMVRVRDAAAFQALADSLGPGPLAEVLALNRVDRAHVRDGDSLVVPAPMRAWTVLAPFPARLPLASPPSRLLLVALRVQAFAAYDSGRRVRWGPTSTGRKEKPTPVGLYHANWKSRRRTSTIDEGWLLEWVVNIDSRGGISLHEYELPGRPASHSCVRLLEDDARWVYDWIEEWGLSDRRTVAHPGTPIAIFGEYAFNAPRPWRRLPEDPHATDVTSDEIAGVLRAWLPADSSATRGAEGAPPMRAPDAGAVPSARASAADSSARRR